VGGTVTLVPAAQKTQAARDEEKRKMKKLNNMILKLQVIKDTRGQDLIEYALMAGFVAVAAGAIVPGVASNIKNIFDKLNIVMSNAAGQG
jgi:pilus assembly protein Flp/PilA